MTDEGVGAPKEDETPRDPLHDKRVRRFWSGLLVSLIGTQLWKVALPWFVWTETGSPIHLALSIIIPLAPALFLGSVAARVADRFDRTQAVVGLEAARGSLFVVLATTLYVVGSAESEGLLLGLLYFVAIVDGFAELWFSGARNGIVKAFASDGHDPARLNSLHNVVIAVASSLGFVLAGAALASVGEVAAFLLNGLSFFVGAVFVASSRAPSGPVSTGRESTGLLRATGIILHDGRLRKAVATLVAINVLAPFLVFILPVLAKASWGGVVWLGVGHLAFELGKLGTSSVRLRIRRTQGLDPRVGIVALGVLVAGTMVVPLPVALVLLGVAGSTAIWMVIDATTSIQVSAAATEVGSVAVAAGVWSLAAVIVVSAMLGAILGTTDIIQHTALGSLIGTLVALLLVAVSTAQKAKPSHLDISW